MKTMTKSPARGDSRSRNLYETTLPTERKIILPTLSNPVVVQRLTRQQIAAIPRDKYAVRVIRHFAYRNRKNRIKKGGLHEELVVVVKIIKQAQSLLDEIHSKYQTLNTTGGGGNIPPEFDIFRSPIDEDKMADCIFKVKEGFFGCHDTCTIGKKECNITDFCLLVHFAFRKMNLLNNYFRKPFCEYLQAKVLMNDEKLKVKNFNNYANSKAYKKLEKDLAHECFNLEERLPKHENPLFLTCHDIARAFHESKYFSQLRTGKNNFKDFIL